MKVANLFEVGLEPDEEDAPGYAVSYARVGPLVGGEQLGLSVYEIGPEQSICPYHYENAEEEWLIVLAGRATVRTPDREMQLEPWDTLLFPDGEAGAHQVANRTNEPLRVAIWSTKQVPHATVYPEDDRILIRPQRLFFRLSDALDTWSG